MTTIAELRMIETIFGFLRFGKAVKKPIIERYEQRAVTNKQNPIPGSLTCATVSEYEVSFKLKTKQDTTSINKGI